MYVHPTSKIKENELRGTMKKEKLDCIWTCICNFICICIVFVLYCICTCILKEEVNSTSSQKGVTPCGTLPYGPLRGLEAVWHPQFKLAFKYYSELF